MPQPERKRDYDWHRHYFTGKLGLAVSLHDEVAQVAETISRLKPRMARILAVRSGSEPLPEDMRQHVDHFERFPDLVGQMSKWEVPAASLSRNFSALARAAAGFPEVDWWTFVTGDTVLLHEYGIERIVADCVGKGCVLGCCRALKQNFHCADLTLEDLEAGKGGGRKQTTDLPDFMPQLFLVSGQEVVEGLFHDIPITNRWTTEQTLGDAFVAWAGQDFRKMRHVYATEAASYADGVVHHARY